MATEIHLEKGKLYRVAVTHCLNLRASDRQPCYYPAEILAENKVAIIWPEKFTADTRRYLKPGEIFMYLGSYRGNEGRFLNYEYSTILLDGRIYTSNLPIDKIHLFYRMEKIDCAI